MAMRIDEKLFRETGCADIPLENKRKPWQRFDCPFCGHERAVINYAANWFQCWACGEKRSGYTSDEASLAVVRYSRQIDRAVAKVKKAFGGWLANVEDDEIIGKARWLVWNYAEGEKGTGNDAGMLYLWKLDCNADEEPWRVEGKLQSVLDRDLTNWADGFRRWEEKHRDEVSVGTLSPVDSSASEHGSEGDGNEWNGESDNRPFIATGAGPGKHLRSREAEQVIKYGVKAKYFCSREPKGTDFYNPYDSGRLRRCELMRNGLGPVQGHCRWCDKALGIPAECPRGDVNLMGDEHDYLHEWFPFLAAIRLDGYTVAALAKERGISVRTVNRRLEQEKHALDQRKLFMLAA